MKKLLLSLLVILFATTASIAQSTTQKQPNELTKLILLKLQAELGIDKNVSANSYATFETYFKEKIAITETANGGENSTDPQVIDALSEITTKRDASLKDFFTTTQFDKWKVKGKAMIASIQ